MKTIQLSKVSDVGGWLKDTLGLSEKGVCLESFLSA